MSLKEYPSIEDRIIELEYRKTTPEYQQFDCSDVLSAVSSTNQELLTSVNENFNVYLNCLQDVSRWKNHVYQSEESPIVDNDYQHTLGMLKISQDLKKLNLNSINFDDVELMILVHDGGEIVTDDISTNSPYSAEYISNVKALEPKVFISCVLRSMKDIDLLTHRAKIGKLYKKYNNRHQSELDTDSHLVKFIDMLQGDYFGLKHVYSKKRLFRVFDEDNLLANPDEIIINNINKEFSQLEVIFKGTDNPSDKEKLFNYFIGNYFDQYKNEEYGYQHLHQHFLGRKDEIFKTL